MFLIEVCLAECWHKKVIRIKSTKLKFAFYSKQCTVQLSLTCPLKKKNYKLLSFFDNLVLFCWFSGFFNRLVTFIILKKSIVISSLFDKITFMLIHYCGVLGKNQKIINCLSGLCSYLCDLSGNGLNI